MSGASGSSRPATSSSVGCPVGDGCPHVRRGTGHRGQLDASGPRERRRSPAGPSPGRRRAKARAGFRGGARPPAGRSRRCSRPSRVSWATRGKGCSRGLRATGCRRRRWAGAGPRPRPRRRWARIHVPRRTGAAPSARPRRRRARRTEPRRYPPGRVASADARTRRSRRACARSRPRPWSPAGSPRSKPRRWLPPGHRRGPRQRRPCWPRRQTLVLPSSSASRFASGQTCRFMNAVTATRTHAGWPSASMTMRRSCIDLPAPAAARSRTLS